MLCRASGVIKVFGRLVMVMTARALDAQPPQPSAAGGLVRVADGVTLIEADDGAGAVFLWGTAAWCWAAGDRAARRLAAVQLVETKAARQRQVAAAFGVNEDSLILWRGDYSANGAIALAGRRPGPKGPSKLTEAKRVEIGDMRAKGLTLIAVAQRAGVSIDTVRRALARAPAPVRVSVPADDPRDRQVPADLLLEAPVVPTGRAVPLAGALVVLPALASTGLLDAVTQVYDRGRAGLSRLRSLVCSMVFSGLLGEPDQGLSCRQPADVGRLLGFGRALDVETMGRWMRELAVLGRAASLLDALARRRLDTGLDVDGILHVGGVARAYRRAEALGGTELARIRLSVGTQLNAWAFDRGGDGVLVWRAPPDASGVEALHAVARIVRDVVGPDARPTVWFDRGGWSPKVFAELTAAGFEVLTYGKGVAHAEPRHAFQGRRFVDERGCVHEYLLAESHVGIGYDGGRRRFKCRRITSLEPRTGHQTQILTSRRDLHAAAIAHATFQRWGQEDLIEFMRVRRGGDALDTCVSEVGPDAACLASEGERLHDAVRMATFSAASALASRLAPDQAGDATHHLLAETFLTPGELQIVGEELHVRLEALSAPRQTRAVAALCSDLTATGTLYPGTNLRLVYSMEEGIRGTARS